MKKIILVLTVSAFSIGAYAGGPECAAKAQGACCADKAKAAGATCQAGKESCGDKSVAMKNAKKIKIVHSPKGAGLSDRAS